MTAEWWSVEYPSGNGWFLAHFTELGLWPTANRKPALASSVTLSAVTEVVQRIKRRGTAPPTWLEN